MTALDRLVLVITFVFAASLAGMAAAVAWEVAREWWAERRVVREATRVLAPQKSHVRIRPRQTPPYDQLSEEQT